MLDDTVSPLVACAPRTAIAERPAGRPLRVIRDDACADLAAGGAGIRNWDRKLEALAYSSAHRCGLPCVLDHREDRVVVVGFAGGLTLSLRGSRDARCSGSKGRCGATFEYLFIYVRACYFCLCFLTYSS